MRTTIDKPLTTGPQRLRLKGETRHWRKISTGLDLGYRRGVGGGMWWLRQYDFETKSYVVSSLKLRSDDTIPADGKSILSFAQATNVALERAKLDRKTKSEPGALTVKEAVDDYVRYLTLERKSAPIVRGRLEHHFVSKIGGRLVSSLTFRELEQIRNSMVRQSDDADAVRKSKATANLTMQTLKAALNRAKANGLVSDGSAWDRLKSFKGTTEPRPVCLDADQVRRLLNVTRGTALGYLCTAAALTGARAPGELSGIKSRDFDGKGKTLFLSGKTGARSIRLSQEAAAFFMERAAGRGPDDLLLPDPDGTRWHGSGHSKLFLAAATRAKCPKGTTIYSLRHSFVTHVINSGWPISNVAKYVGTSAHHIENTYAHVVAAQESEAVEAHAMKLNLVPDKKVRALR